MSARPGLIGELAFIDDGYAPRRYYQLDVGAGVLRSSVGARLLSVSEDMILGIHEALADETGEAAPVVLYSCGRWWGKRLIRRLLAEQKQLFGHDTLELPLGAFAVLLRRAFACLGWGQVELDFSLQEQGFVGVMVERPMYAETVGVQEQPSEALLAGVFAAMVSELAGRELEAAQLLCPSVGNSHASFLIGLKGRVAVINAWQAQGRSLEDIRSGILDGSLAVG